MNENNSLDFLAIGDTVVDAFIKVDVGHVQEHNGATEYCVPFGSKIPFESVEVLYAVGNSANAAVSAARLGISSGLLAFVGNDEDGKRCLTQLQNEKVDTRYMGVQDGKTTNYHYVLWHGDERTILIKHEHFMYTLPDIGKPRYLYLSSLGQGTEAFHEEIMNYLDANPDVKLTFQPGTFQMKMGIEKLARLYRRCEVFCANKEEYMQMLNTDSHDVKFLMDEMEKNGPKILLLSDGPHGAYMKANGNHYQRPLYPDIGAPLERTGAGDAFCSTFTAALALGKTPEEALLWGPINSMNVVQHVGAQNGLLARTKLEELLQNAPEYYKVSSL